MDLQDALTLARENAEKHTRSFVSFFHRGELPPPEQEISYNHVISGALIYLVVGVTLQDSFISGRSVSEISWLDRALGQMVFWITIGLIVQSAINMIRPRGNYSGFLITFRVMPVAFLCGAYAAAIGYFLAYVIRVLAGTTFPTLPALSHVAFQLAIIGIYMPREVRAHADLTPSKSRLVTVLVLSVVLLIDLAVVFGPLFLSSGGA